MITPKMLLRSCNRQLRKSQDKTPTGGCRFDRQDYDIQKYHKYGMNSLKNVDNAILIG